MRKTYEFKEEGLDPLYFYHDLSHPYPYWENLVYSGMEFYFVITKEQRPEFLEYVKKLRRERDVVKVVKFYLKNGKISRS